MTGKFVILFLHKNEAEKKIKWPKQEKAFSSNKATTVPESESGTLITAIVNLQVAL